MSRIVNQAKQAPLELSDLPNVMECDAAATALRKLEAEDEKYRQKQQADASSTPLPRPTLSQMLYNSYGTEFRNAGLVKLGHDILQYVQVILIGLLIQFIENGGTDKIVTGSVIPSGYVYAVLLFMCQIVQNCFLNAYFHKVYRIGLQARCFVISAIYRKSLKVSMTEQVGASTGAVVNLMSNDASRVTRLSSYGHNLWSSPFQIVVAFTMLMLYIGPSAIVGLVVMAVSVPLKKWLAKKLEQLRQQVIVVTDRRVRLINDVLQGIQIIKLYAWEKSFLSQILNVRAEEMQWMTREITLGAVNRTMWNLTPLFVTLSTFAVYAYTGGDMKASKVFTALSLFRRVRFPLSVFPQMITNLIDFFVASKRITEFLHQKEVGGLRSVRATTGEATGEVRVTMKNSAFGWHHGVSEEKEEKEEKEGKEGKEGQEGKEGKEGNEGKEGKEETKQEGIEVVAEMNEATNNTAFALHGINLHLQNEELILVVGRVGSGKSSLLSAMLGEMEQTEGDGTTEGTEGGGTTGTTTLSGSVAYVPQSSWILNATLKENGTAHYLSILCRYSQTQAVAVLTVLTVLTHTFSLLSFVVVMGDPAIDEDKYQRALVASNLIMDVGILMHGDMTEIGEKGITLSGGQKQRVALARAGS